jgi:ligand-binding sensor domain-containing protein
MFWPVMGLGQAGGYYFDHYRLPEGFTCKSSRDALQDKNGYIYITTENGLVRYNGHQFKYYREDKSNPKALQASYCLFMEKDGRDKIWLMAGPELQVFDPVTETFMLIKKQVKDSLASFVPFSFAYDARRNWMWVACSDGLYVSKNDSYILEPVQPSHRYNDDWMRDLMISNDKVYGVNNDGVFVFDIRENKSYFHDLTPHFEDKSLSGFALYIEKDDEFYISTWRNSIVHYDLKTKKLTKHFFSDRSKEHNGVVALYKDKSENKLWVGSLLGLYTFDLGSQKFTSYRSTDINDHTGIRGAVHNFCFDDQNGLWICGGEGLFRLDFNKQFVSKHEIPFLSQKSGHYSPGVFAFERHPHQKDSILWIQLSYRELYRYDFIHKKQLALPSKMAGYGKRKDIGIFNLNIDSRNRVWYMTNEHGLIVYDIAEERFIVPPKTQFFQDGTWVVNIYERKNSDILICTYNGLYKMSPDNQITEFTVLNSFLRKNDFRYIRMVDEDSKGNIILSRAANTHSTDANVVKYNPQTHEITTLSKKDCPAFDKITTMEYMIVNEKDQIFVGSYNGVAIFNTSLDCNSVRYFNTENGLSNESVYNFDESYDGRVWYNHEFGLTQYIPQYDHHQHVTYYNSALSLSRAYTTMSPNTGILYTGINKGFEIIDINKKPDQSPSKLIISQFSIDNKPLQYHGGKIVVSHKDFPIHIEVSLLQYTNSAENTYFYSINDGKKYPLDGNILKFDKLPAGTYRVNITGKNFYGREAKLDQIEMKVLPPFYQTWWFITACAFCFAFAVFYYYRMKDQHRQNLTKIRDNISKDLHDDLGSNLMHIKLLSELELIKKSAPDKHTFKTIAEEIKVVMDNMSDIVWLTQPQFDHLDDLVARIKKLTVDLLEKKGMEVMWQKDDLSMIRVDVNTRKQFYLALKEIINNCGKYSQATKVWIEIKLDSKRMVVSIKDNGVGFDPDIKASGNGLRNIKARILDCKGEVEVNTAPGEGVHYIIHIPVK